MKLLDKTFALAYFNALPRPTWEFVPEGETLERWTRLFRVIDYVEAKTPLDLARISQALQASYTQNAGQILKAQTITNAAGYAFNFVVAAFDHPAQKQFEIHFVKIFLAGAGGVAQIYTVRVSDFLDYLTKAKQFLEHESGAIGHALGESQWPTPDQLPREVPR